MLEPKNGVVLGDNDSCVSCDCHDCTKSPNCPKFGDVCSDCDKSKYVVCCDEYEVGNENY